MLELLFPGFCIACGWRAREGYGLCSLCLEKVCWLEIAACIRCGRSQHPQGQCPASRHYYNRALALAAYREPWRRAVWAVKFGLDKQIAADMASSLVELAEKQGIRLPDLVIPAPGASLKWQRFDGVTLLAKILASQTQAGFIQCLERLPGRRPQVGLDWYQRRRGMDQYIQVSRGFDLRGKGIWLVDDVYTTGATADASAIALLKAGTSSVAVLTLAN